MSNQIIDYPTDPIPHDDNRGPGWFLKISYVVIVSFMLYYLYANWAWKSNYDEQQEKIKTELSK